MELTTHSLPLNPRQAFHETLGLQCYVPDYNLTGDKEIHVKQISKTCKCDDSGARGGIRACRGMFPDLGGMDAEGVAGLRGERAFLRSGQRRLFSWTLEITKKLGQPKVGWGTVWDKPLIWSFSSCVLPLFITTLNFHLTFSSSEFSITSNVTILL